MTFPNHRRSPASPRPSAVMAPASLRVLMGLCTLLVGWGLSFSAQAQLFPTTAATRASLLSTAQNVTPLATWLGNYFALQTNSYGNLTDANTWAGANSFTNPPTSPAALPTISSCGTGTPAMSAGSNASAGAVTLGTGTPTACTVTFATAYATHSFCTVTPASSGGAAITGGFYLSANDKTGFTLTLGTGTSSLVFNYTCFGN